MTEVDTGVPAPSEPTQTIPTHTIRAEAIRACTTRARAIRHPARPAAGRFAALLLLAGLVVPLAPRAVHAQALDLSHGGPIAITASEGIEWRQAEREVIARGNAKAVRGDTTVTADRLIAWYRKKGETSAKPAQASQAGLASDVDTGGNEIYRVRAEGNVHIYTPTDQAWGDRATYDLDQAVMVMTGRHLRLTTPNEVLTARDDLEYWTLKHMAVARGDAVVVTKDHRRLSADTLVAYTAPAAPEAANGRGAASGRGGNDMLGSSGKLVKVEAYGHVSVRTATDTVTGDRGVYVPDTGIAVLSGNVRITRGQNQLNGAQAEVNLKTGVARLISGSSHRVQGLVVPNDETNKGLTAPSDGQARKAPAAGGSK